MPHVPRFDKNGNLPPGEWLMEMDEIASLFTWNAHRKKLFVGLVAAANNLALSGAAVLWVAGSFVTAKEVPGDVDGCWAWNESVDFDRLDPVFLSVDPPRVAMKAKYFADFLIADVPLLDERRIPVLTFFQRDRDGHSKGIVRIDLHRLREDTLSMG